MSRGLTRWVLVALWVLLPIVLVLSVLYPPVLAAVVVLWAGARLQAMLIEGSLTGHGLLFLETLAARHGGIAEAHDFLETLDQPPFYDTETLPWTRTVQARFPEVAAEITAYVGAQGGSFERAYDNALMRTGAFWTARSVLGWGLPTTADLPTTRALMQEIGAITCNVSRLAPGSTIRRHHGETNATVRCHLPIRIPGVLPEVGLEVGGERRPWHEGQLIAFNDLDWHGAFNRCDRDRIVLIFDVMRPGFEAFSSWVRCRKLVYYSFLALTEASQETFPAALVRVWARVFDVVASPPLQLALWAYFRFVCVRPPFWLRGLRGTAFYF